MRLILGLGSNEGNRVQFLEEALNELKTFGSLVRVSPTYETASLAPDVVPNTEWLTPFLNLVVEFQLHHQWTPQEFFSQIKKIETHLGRKKTTHWSPRCIDIDILFWGDQEFNLPDLKIPHPRWKERAFVLDPLKDLKPLTLHDSQSNLFRARKNKNHVSSLMAIINVTPDSFSDGGKYSDPQIFARYLDEIEDRIGFVDIGAESTRPGAKTISVEQEWERLKPYLKHYYLKYKSRSICPRLSVDSRNFEIIKRSLDFGVELINDVSGLIGACWASLFDLSHLNFVLMHNLGVPPQRNQTLDPLASPINQIKSWLGNRIDELTSQGLDKNRIIIDPGIGFGKTPEQNIEILANIKELHSLECRILVGASRKSFFKSLNPYPQEKQIDDLDDMTLGLSHYLDEQGIDIMRLHKPLSYHIERLTQKQLRSFYGCKFNSN